LATIFVDAAIVVTPFPQYAYRLLPQRWGQIGDLPAEFRLRFVHSVL